MGSYPFKNYMYVTGAYWVFTLTDGALRMLVLLHFYTMGYDAFQIALLFFLYEVAGVFTNLIGGIILYVGLGFQVIALSALANFDPSWPTWQAVVFVMGLQALSGIAKDLTKLSAKSIVKIVSPDAGEGALFKWVAILTGSKNALKGIGFFLGGVLLAWVGYAPALFGMAAAVALALGGVLVLLTADIGKAKEEIKFFSIFSNTPAINILSIAPKIVEGDAASARLWLLVLIFVTAVMSTSLYFDIQSALTVVIGLIIFGILFALNSSIHSFLILAYSDSDKIALNVGFYYTANAGGRLIGILLSGLTYQQGGIFMCLVTALSFLIVSWLIALSLPKMEKSTNSPD